jgi:hypothetical protein
MSENMIIEERGTIYRLDESRIFGIRSGCMAFLVDCFGHPPLGDSLAMSALGLSHRFEKG